jgi:small subunit ribosomal protein S3
MGNKANPKGLRLGIVRDWDSVWFAEANYPALILEDISIRNFLKEELLRAGVSEIKIKRKTDVTEAVVVVARPGIILGKTGIDLAAVRKQLGKILNKKINITIVEEKHPDLSSRLLGTWITGQLERRIPFRRAMKMAIQRALKSGAEGIKIACAGRLGGAEIARTEWYSEGKVPLHTFRADIDYTFTEALTTYGKIGVKVWIYKGDVLSPNEVTAEIAGQ